MSCVQMWGKSGSTENQIFRDIIEHFCMHKA
jgi:hypothetical protein